MKSVTIVAFALLAAVHAQDQCTALAAKIPQCAVKCIGAAASSTGCKDPTDLACQCENIDKINTQAIDCVLSGCKPEEGIEAQSAAAAVCECVASAGPSASSPVTSTAPASSAEPTTATTPPSSSSPPYPTTVSQIGDGQIQVGTATASSIVPQTTSVAPFEGAAAKIGGSFVAVVAGLLVAVAAM